MSILTKALEGHSTFFKEHAEGFLSLSQTTLNTTLPSLHDCLQSRILLLIDCKRAVHRDVLYSQLNGQDISQITKIMKEMRYPLHGIGVSQILKQELFASENAQKKRAAEVLENAGNEKVIEFEQEVLMTAIAEVKPFFQQAVDALHDAIDNCIIRFRMLHPVIGRSSWCNVLWPFPRVFHYQRKTEPTETLNNMSSSQLEDIITEVEIAVDKKMLKLLETHWETPLQRHFGGMHLVALYRFCIKEYSNYVIQLLLFIEQAETTRQQPRLWFPTPKSVRKWLRDTQNTWSSAAADTEGGSDNNEGNDDPTELTLLRTHTKREETNYDGQEDGDSTCAGGAFVTSSGKRYNRDPDVDPPVTRIQKFFYCLFRIRQWLRQPLTFTALKTAAGTVVLASPVYLPGSAGWFIDWRGQWALIIMMLWMVPSTGMFFYT